MRKLLFLLFIINQLAFGQDGTQRTFKMAVVKPSGAKIEKSLEVYTDSIELTYQNQYFTYKEYLKETLSRDADFYPEDMRADFEENKKNAKIELKQLDSLESTILNYKYYELLSYYSTSILNMAFNEYEPYSTIYEVKSSEIKDLELSKYAEKNNIDFIVIFENIKATEENDNYKMSLDLKLYSTKEKKIVLENEIYGNTNSYGGMWTCGNPLTCLFITSVKNSLEVLIPEIRQKL